MKREDNEQSKDKNGSNSGSKNSESNQLLGPSLINNARSVMNSAQETAFLEAEDEDGSVETGSEENADGNVTTTSEVFLNQ